MSHHHPFADIGRPHIAAGFAGVLERLHKDQVPNFAAINSAALAVFPAVLARLLPSGKTVGREYQALNPLRFDRSIGSFKINLDTGRWADFATEDAGGDAVSLVAYLESASQSEAARLLARMLCIDCEG